MTHATRGHSDVPTLAEAGVVAPGSAARDPRAGTVRPTRLGFTLIELLTVIAVIGILTAIVLVVGANVLGNQRVKQTESTLMALDRALEEYITVVGAIPRYDPEAYEDVPGDSNGTQSYADGLHCARPDAAVFLRQVRGFGEVDAIWQGIGERNLRLTINNPADADDPTSVAGDPTPSVVDAWAASGWPGTGPGTPPDERFDVAQQQVIYYVHPDNTLAQDLYGQCLNRRPYFMSAGPDMLYGLRNEPPFEETPVTVERAESFVEDNVYSYEPGPIRREMPAPARAWRPQ